MLNAVMVAIGVMFFFGLVALLFALVLKGKQSTELPYQKADALFTPAERSFLGVLDQAVATNYRVFGKVRIADVLNVSKGGTRARRTTAFNKISAKHFDYVICRATDLSIACVLELDDKSHSALHRRKRDEFVEAACQAANLPLVRVTAKTAYTVAEIRSQLFSAMRSEVFNTADKTSTALPPKCPKCSSEMQLRKLTSGSNAGTAFWGCNDFPSCRGCVPA